MKCSVQSISCTIVVSNVTNLANLVKWLSGHAEASLLTKPNNKKKPDIPQSLLHWGLQPKVSLL